MTSLHARVTPLFLALLFFVGAASLAGCAKSDPPAEDYDRPTVTISAEPTAGVAPINVSFSATVEGGSGDYAYEWDFGDGASGDSENPSHRYTEAGVYTATLVVRDRTSLLDSEPKSIEIQVADNDTPAASASASPTSGLAPLEVSFSGTAVGGNEPLSYQWVFGDGSDPVDEQNTTHTYQNPGTYNALLRVTDSDGDTATSEVSIEVIPSTVPTVSITATPTQGIAPLTVNFTSTVADGSGQYEYSWDFGDGTTSDARNPSHRYEDGGTFTATLVVTDNASGLDSDPQTVDIEVASNEAPVASASASPDTGIAPLTVSFSGSAAGGNAPLAYEWNFGDGSSAVTSQNPSHEYTSPGTYNAQLTVTDADGDSDTATVAIKVNDNLVPSADIKATPQSGIAPVSVSFDPQVQGGDAPLSFAWDFGDGNTSTTRNPSHTYQTPGTYTASVTVTDDNGDTGTDTIDITVTDNSVPQVTASATPTSGLAPLQVQFSSNASGGDAPLSYSWEFGDGTTSTTQDPIHTYQTAGQYTATLTVTDDNGDTATTTVDIDAGSDSVPTANASASPQQGFAPLQVQFFGNGSGGNAPLSYAWSFGDGNNDTAQNPTHTYQNPGTYTASLVVTDSNGDSANSTVEITVLDNSVPQVSANASPTTGIVPTNVSFSSTINGGDAPFTYEWNFGDGSPTSDVANPSHSYTTAGSFSATLTVTDNNGDTASDSVQIDIASNDVPAVTASVDNDTGTAPLSVNFSATGTGGNAPLSYTWYVGDGSSPKTGQSISHTYQNTGIYTAEVVVTDANGDTASDTIQINVVQDAPDLAVQSFSATVNGTSVTYDLVIENRGTQDAIQPFDVRFYNDLASAPDASTSADYTAYVGDVIAAGDTYTVTRTVDNLALGNYDSYTFIDPQRDNPDVDRANNVGGPEPFSVDGLVINEVYYDSPSGDTGVFIELYGRPGADISGYTLEAINGADGTVYDTITLPSSSTIPADGYFVVGDASAANTDYVTSKADLQNGADSIMLTDDAGAIKDALGYGDFSASPGNFAGEGASADDAPAGYSVGRKADNEDTGDNSADFYLWPNPTPGSANEHAFTNNSDTCTDAFLLSDGVAGSFYVDSDLGGLANDYGTFTNSSSCTGAIASSPAGPDQVFQFVVPTGMTADVELYLDDNASIDIDSVLTGDPCSSLDSGYQACNVGFTENITGLTAGTYYIVVYEDDDTSLAGSSEPFEYEVDITLY
jgi:PKD repeat protein